ncbi:MAG TPA: RICIN domain-containing protein [Pyrinomonadaceae bacterium]|nr:RICIN domain-containing protein [Pyrinomonadaceae bacterium]
MNAENIIIRAVKSSRARLLVALFILGCAAPAALAQSTLQCGARIVSNMRTPDGAPLCLFAMDSNNGSRVAVRRCGNLPGFLWKITRRDGGGLHILTAIQGSEARRMDVQDFGKHDGARIHLWSPNVHGIGYRNQTWDFFPSNRGDGSFHIISVDSGKCLNIPLGTGTPLDQLFLQQFACSHAINDTWRIQPVERGCS